MVVFRDDANIDLEREQLLDEEFADILREELNEKNQFLKDIKNGKKQWTVEELTNELVTHKLTPEELKPVLSLYGDYAFNEEMARNPQLIVEQLKGRLSIFTKPELINESTAALQEVDNIIKTGGKAFESQLKETPSLINDTLLQVCTKYPEAHRVVNQLIEENYYLGQNQFLKNIIEEKKSLLGNSIPYNKIGRYPKNGWQKEKLEFYAEEYAYLDTQIQKTPENTNELLDENIKIYKDIVANLKQTVKQKNLEHLYGGLDFETVCGGEERIKEYSEAALKQRSMRGKTPISAENMQKQVELRLLKAETTFYNLAVAAGLNNATDFNVWNIDTNVSSQKAKPNTQQSGNPWEPAKMALGYDFKGAYDKYQQEQSELKLAGDLMNQSKQTYPPREMV